MLPKLLIPIIFLVAQFLITAWGDFTGRLSTKITLFGHTVDNLFLRAFITQLEYFWILIIINFLFMLGFKLGYANFQQFLIIIFIWLASGPIAALLYNFIFKKEPLNWAIGLGAFLVFAGAFLIVGNKEILKLLE